MKITNIKELKEKIQTYDIIILILMIQFMLTYYDTPALKEVAKYLSKIINIKSTKFFLKIRTQKLRRGKHPLFIFNNILIKKFNKKYQDKLIKILLNYFSHIIVKFKTAPH